MFAVKYNEKLTKKLLEEGKIQTKKQLSLTGSLKVTKSLQAT